MESKTEKGLQEVLALMEKGEPEEAQKIISKLFEDDLDCKELICTNKYCMFWIDSRRRLKTIKDPYELSDNILLEWKACQNFILRDTRQVYDAALYAVQKGFFSTALKYYTKFFEERDAFTRAEFYKKAGICYKKLGDFENARACLTESNNIYPNSAPVIAELADCYCLCGEDRFGKLLFREAFFIKPDAIDIDFLDSELIKCLISIVTKKGYSGKQILYWIPVYGVLSGILNIKRELTSQEVAKLRKDIYAMENESKDPACNKEILVPVLLNNYFWLIDHYNLKRESIDKINDVLLKIKILDSKVHDLYRKSCIL